MCAKRYDDENPTGFDPDELEIFNEDDEFEDEDPQDPEEKAPKEKKQASGGRSRSAPNKKSRRRNPQASEDAERDEKEAAEKVGADKDDAASEEQAKPEPEPEPVEPDHPDIVAALKDLGARIELNDAGNVWRLFFYEKNNDQQLAQIRDLHSLKEIWLLGTEVTAEAAKELKERLPAVTVHHK